MRSLLTLLCMSRVKQALARRIKRLEGVEDPVATCEKDQSFTIHFNTRRRGPRVVEYIGRDVLVVTRDEFACPFVQHYEARRIGCANALVRIVHTGARVDVKIIAVNEYGAVRRVVRPGASLAGEIEFPDNIGIERAGLNQLSVCGRAQDFGISFRADLLPRRAVGT